MSCPPYSTNRDRLGHHNLTSCLFHVKMVFEKRIDILQGLKRFSSYGTFYYVKKDFLLHVSGGKKHLLHSSEFLHSELLNLRMFQCCCEAKGVLYGGCVCDSATLDAITCIECLQGGGKVSGEKYLVSSF